MSDIWQIVDKEPKQMSKKALLDKLYPTEPNCENYLVYKIKRIEGCDFKDSMWNISKLPSYENNTDIPFAVTLSELSKASIKK